MNNPIYTIIKPNLVEGNAKLIENIKILLYKQNLDIFEILDFENEVIYKE
jgi:hypothetical protein